MKSRVLALLSVFAVGCGGGKLPSELPIRLAEARGQVMMERITSQSPRPQRVLFVQVGAGDVVDAEWKSASAAWGSAEGLERLLIAKDDPSFPSIGETGISAETLRKMLQGRSVEAVCLMSRLDEGVASLAVGSVPSVYVGIPVTSESVWAQRAGKGAIKGVLTTVEGVNLAGLDPETLQASAAYRVLP